jgi:hypothetical protein
MKHTSGLLLLAALLVEGCSEVSLKEYDGPAKVDTEISIVRLWTPTETNVFELPGLMVEKIDEKPVEDYGRASHAYLLPGRHDFQIHLLQVKGYNLLCGALCDAIFNKPQFVHATTRAGHAYTFRYVNNEKGTVVLDDRGTHYDPRCLKARQFKDGTNC